MGYGQGWYCNDGAEADCEDDGCDYCQITPGCTQASGAVYDGSKWVCADPCFVHENCNAGISWEDSGKFGQGWYCDDGVDADCESNKCDSCQIYPGCSSVQSGTRTIPHGSAQHKHNHV